MTDKITITTRPADAYDFVNIARLLGEGVQEAAVGYPPINDQKLLQWIMDTKRSGEIVVADCSGRIVGAIGLLVREWAWSTERYIGNEFLFVKPKYRPHGTFEALMTAAEFFAERSKLRLVIGFSGGDRAYAKDRLMKRRQYIYCGGMFARPYIERGAVE